jgi:hypothetical protein
LSGGVGVVQATSSLQEVFSQLGSIRGAGVSGQRREGISVGTRVPGKEKMREDSMAKVQAE